MAKAKFSRKEFEKVIKLTPQIEEKIRLFGTPLESIDENHIEVEIFPNRPDLLSLQGYLRSFKAFLGKEKGLKNYIVKSSGQEIKLDSSLPVEWPFALACIIKGIKFDDDRIKEVIDIQEKLASTLLRKRKKGGIGLYPLDKINFPIRFVGLPSDKISFRPLEYPQNLNAKEILSKHPTGREYKSICENWNTFPVFIDKSNNIMSMPPIINSHDLGRIDTTTKDVFLEVTGNDLNILKKTIVIIAASLADMGGKIYSIDCIQKDKTKILSPDFTVRKMKLSIENVNKLLGFNLKENDLINLLSKMGYNYKKSNVYIPAWRVDILHEVDIIEDIAIAYGYNNIVPVLPNFSSVGEESEKEKIKRKISEILIGLSLQEISTYHLVKQEEIEKLKNIHKLEVKDSKTEYKFLRPNLLLPSLRIFSENKDNEYPQNLFEIGTIFLKNEKSENQVKEIDNLIIASSPANFTKLKQFLDLLMRVLELNYNLIEKSKEMFIDGRTASILLDNKEIGYIGEIHPETLRQFGIKMPIAVLEISINDLILSLNYPK